MRPIWILATAAVLAACSSDETPTPTPGADAPITTGTPDAALPDAAPDAMPPIALAPCPTSGKGALELTNATCVLVTPEATGAAASGEAADVPSYAIAPTSAPSGELVLFLNGSGGSPLAGAADPTMGVYSAALASGHHVIGLSYRSGVAIGDLCHTDPCYEPTRLTILTGAYQSGAASEVADIQPTEGVHERLALLLRALAVAQPDAGWGDFVTDDADPAAAIVWSKVIVSGHSQGGGHAALLGKIHAVARIVSLSSPCDRVGKNVATWLDKDASWQTDPTAKAYGFGAATQFDDAGNVTGGDDVCPGHSFAWAAMQIDPSRQFDDAVVCGAGSAHGATIACTDNFDRLKSLFAP